MTHPAPFSSPEPLPSHSSLWATRRRIAEQLRRLNEHLLTHDIQHEELTGVEMALDGLLAVGQTAPPVHGRMEWAALGGDHGTYHLLSRETTPLAGHSNALSPPLHMWLDRENGEAHAHITLGWTHEGPPGCVHGGWVAALFDDFLGCAQLLTGQSGATGTLNVRYKRPTPLNEELTLRAWVKEVNGRKIVMEGTISARGEITATCEGLFVSFAGGVLNLVNRRRDED